MRQMVVGRVVVLAGLICLCGFLPGGAAESAPKLHYGFQKGRPYAYEVTIVAQLPDEELTHSGTLNYTVLSATDEQFVVRCSGNLVASAKATASAPRGFGPPRRMGPPRMSRPPIGPFAAPSRPAGTTFSRLGEMVIVGSDASLPFLLGAQERLVIEPLPEAARVAWSKDRDLGVIEQSDSGSGPFSHAFGPRSTAETQRGAKERTDYSVLETKEGMARISKKYSLKTAAEAGGLTRIDMTGAGEFEFDLKEGAIKSQSMKYDIKVNEKNVTLTIPVTIKYRMLTAAEVAERDKKAADAAAAAAEAQKPKPFQPGERAKLLKDLRSADDKTIQAAAKRLAKTIPDDTPAEISHALCKAMKGTNEWIQADLLAALEVWLVPDAEKTVIEASKSKTFFVRGKAISLLGKFKTATAAEAAAAQMFQDRGATAAALKAIGPIAEPCAIPFLKDRDFWVRGEACGILSEIGGKKSLKALKEAAENLETHERHGFDGAIAAIQKRLAQSSDEHEETAEEKPASTATAGEKTRIWRDATGTFEIEATLVTFDDSKVTIKKTGGREISVPIEKLSEPDQAYLAERAKAKKSKPVNPFDQ